MPPDQFVFDGFEEHLDGGIVIKITFAADGDFEAMLEQYASVVMRTASAAAIAVEDAAFGW